MKGGTPNIRKAPNKSTQRKKHTSDPRRLWNCCRCFQGESMTLKTLPDFNLPPERCTFSLVYSCQFCTSSIHDHLRIRAESRKRTGNLAWGSVKRSHGDHPHETLARNNPQLTQELSHWSCLLRPGLESRFLHSRDQKWPSVRCGISGVFFNMWQFSNT